MKWHSIAIPRELKSFAFKIVEDKVDPVSGNNPRAKVSSMMTQAKETGIERD